MTSAHVGRAAEAISSWHRCDRPCRSHSPAAFIGALIGIAGSSAADIDQTVL